jgi:hypothetical protein
VKTRLQDRLRGSQRDRVAPDTGPMTGSINHQQPSTIRGEAQYRHRRVFLSRVLIGPRAVVRVIRVRPALRWVPRASSCWQRGSKGRRYASWPMVMVAVPCSLSYRAG